MRQPKNDEERKSLKLKSLTESKKMQADYEKGSVEKREEIFIIAYHKLFEMIYDTYNNYIIQKIFELG